MTPIQLLLLLIVAVIVLLYFRRLRTRLFDRLFFLMIGASAGVLVAKPEWATAIANALGVDRGADLVNYLGLLGLGFLWLVLYTRQREIDDRLTDLARKMALLEAKKPKK
ncbi:MAG: DUF2304 domain-containing protein [Chloroflexi bacterium]|nr:DUF2304 domain-containing protein [Chloroflexota bacterium]